LGILFAGKISNPRDLKEILETRSKRLEATMEQSSRTLKLKDFLRRRDQA
jgi:hypothetical protein